MDSGNDIKNNLKANAEAEEGRIKLLTEKLENVCKSKLSQIMNKNVVCVTDNTGFTEFAEILEKYEYKGVPVIDDKNKMVGIVTWSDMLKLLLFYSSYGKRAFDYDSFMGIPSVRSIRSDNPISLSPEDTLEDAAHLMFENNIQTIPIVNKDEVVGIIGKKDLIKEILKAINEVDKIQ